jgi:hypothetical protein
VSAFTAGASGPSVYQVVRLLDLPAAKRAMGAARRGARCTAYAGTDPATGTGYEVTQQRLTIGPYGDDVVGVRSTRVPAGLGDTQVAETLTIRVGAAIVLVTTVGADDTSRPLTESAASAAVARLTPLTP